LVVSQFEIFFNQKINANFFRKLLTLKLNCMKNAKLLLSVLFVFIIFNNCTSLKQLGTFAFPRNIQPLNLTLVPNSDNGTINCTVGVQLVNPAKTPGSITYSAAQLVINISPINYIDANGNCHTSKTLFPAILTGRYTLYPYQSVSQTLTYPTADETNIIQSLPLMSMPIQTSSINTAPDPQTGDYDRYLITVYIGYELPYNSYYYIETQYNDMLAITPTTVNGQKTVPVNFNLQFCVGHRNYYLQSNDDFKTPLIPYNDSTSRWSSISCNNN
jgi:hypothetical protein